MLLRRYSRDASQIETPYNYRYGETSSSVDFTVTIKNSSDAHAYDNGEWRRLVFHMRGQDTCNAGNYSASQFEITTEGTTNTYSNTGGNACLIYVVRSRDEYYYTYKWISGSGVNYISRSDCGSWESGVGSAGHNFWTANNSYFDKDNLVPVGPGEFKVRIYQVASKWGNCYGGIYNYATLVKYR